MDFDTELVEKFLNGTASKDEARKVLNWFQTKEGLEYLDKRFNKDALDFGFPSEISNINLPSFNSESIEFQKSPQPRKMYRQISVWAVAASIVLLISILSVLNIYQTGEQKLNKNVHSTVYNTSHNEHRIITLTDGTRIRLNENTHIDISDFNNAKYRSVNLEGEAFFEVAHNPSKPFQVESKHGLVTVLGTAFNIKTSGESRDLLIVAVSEGKVSLRQNEQIQSGEQILEKNQVGLLNTETSEIRTEDMNVRNYFTWMHGRVVYDKTPFKIVMKQLSHIYQIENKIADTELNDMILTADFSERSLNNVIETIAHSLNIRAVKKGNTVTWSLATEKR